MVTATLITELVIPSAGLDLKPEMEFGVPHFLMMGLDERHDGSYSNQDVLYSASFDTVAARDAANLARAKERLREMGAAGLAKHLKNKLLVVYADGTYAWAEEGTFFKQYVARPPSAVTDFLRSFYYEDGALYEGFRTVEHLIWLLLFACSGGVALYLRCTKAYDPTVCAAVTALLGLLAYELLFEARARYLFIYGPFFILLAVLGWKGIRSTASAARKQYLQNLKNKA